MIIGYVFSRKDNREWPIARDRPPPKDVFENKLYELLKPYILKI